MESNSLKMIQIDRNMLKLWQIVYTNIILTIVHLLILLQEIKTQVWFLRVMELSLYKCYKKNRNNQKVFIEKFFCWNCNKCPKWPPLRLNMYSGTSINGACSLQQYNRIVPYVGWSIKNASCVFTICWNNTFCMCF